MINPRNLARFCIHESDNQEEPDDFSEVWGCGLNYYVEVFAEVKVPIAGTVQYITSTAVEVLASAAKAEKPSHLAEVNRVLCAMGLPIAHGYYGDNI
jgi:hypothetical protein